MDCCGSVWFGVSVCSDAPVNRIQKDGESSLNAKPATGNGSYSTLIGFALDWTGLDCGLELNGLLWFCVVRCECVFRRSGESYSKGWRILFKCQTGHGKRFVFHSHRIRFGLDWIGLRTRIEWIVVVLCGSV